MTARTSLLALLALAAPTAATATPSQAASLGGLDLYYPNELDTFMYFGTDLNLYVNPALAHRFRDQVQINLGFSPGGAFEGAGTNPRGFALFGIGEALTLGFGLNRSPGEVGEKAALGRTLDQLMAGSATSGEIGGGTYNDPLTLSGLGAPSNATPVQAPLDLFGAFHSGSVSVGANVYAAFGSSSASTETEAVPGGFDGDWSATSAQTGSSYVGATVGVAVKTDTVSPEGWLRLTRAGSWSDTQAFGPNQRDQWDPEVDSVVDRTVGLAGVTRFGLGGRATIAATDAIDIVPALMFDLASGHTFAIDRLADDHHDPQETLQVQAEDDTFSARTITLRFGSGFAWRPEEDLEVIATVSGQVDLDRTLFDDNAQQLGVLGSTRTQGDIASSVLRLPVVSIGAQHDFSEHFGVRGAIRSAPLLHRVNTTTTTRFGIEADNWNLNETGSFVSHADVGDAPPLTAAVGPSVRLGPATLDGALGGAMTGAGLDLFSRIDAKFAW